MYEPWIQSYEIDLVSGLKLLIKNNYDFILTIDWNSLIVGKISPWLDLDSDNETVRKNSELVSHLTCTSFYGRCF